MYRAIDRQRAEATHSSLVIGVETLPDIPVSVDEPLERILWRQQLEALRQAIEALPPRCRQVFLLHRLHDMPQADVADALGISRNMVARHMMRAMQSLAPLLEPEINQGNSSRLPQQQPCAAPASLPHTLTSTANGQAI